MVAPLRRLLLALLLTLPALAVRAQPGPDNPNKPAADQKPTVPPSDEAVLRAARMATDGPGLLDLFRKQTLGEADQKRINRHIEQLGHKNFVVREQASAALLAEGSQAVPLLRQALKQPDAEVQFRVQECLARLGDSSLAGRLAAAARLLRVRRPAGAAAVLLDYLPSAVDEQVEDEVFNTLALLGVEEGKVAAVLVPALEDKVAARRAAAALVLGRSGTAGQRDAVRALLDDADAGVRFRAAQGLLAGRDRRALPALTTLLSEGPPEVAVRAEDLLYCLAGAQAPRVALGNTPASRKRCRTAWEQWWKVNEKRLDLAKADADLPPHNRGLQVRALARQFAEALFRADEAVLKQVTDVPFTATGKKVYTERAELEQELFAELADGSTGQRASFSLGPTIGVADLGKLLGVEERALLNPLRKPENRVVVVRAQVANEPQALCVLVRESKQGLHVIGLVQMGGARPPW
jgi:HEAT repeat protein